MTKVNDTKFFKKLLTEFVLEEDPLYSMLQWITQSLIQCEAENVVGVLPPNNQALFKGSFSSKSCLN